MVLALLLAWMNCWRAVFAGRLFRQLSGSPPIPRGRGAVPGISSPANAFLGSHQADRPCRWHCPDHLRLLAWSVAFYRSATALAGREDLDPDASSSGDARTSYWPASIGGKQPGSFCRFLTFLLGLAFTIDLALALAMPAATAPHAHRVRIAIQPQRSVLHLYAAVSVGHARGFLDGVRSVRASGLLPSQFPRKKSVTTGRRYSRRVCGCCTTAVCPC